MAYRLFVHRPIVDKAHEPRLEECVQEQCVVGDPARRVERADCMKDGGMDTDADVTVASSERESHPGQAQGGIRLLVSRSRRARRGDGLR
ncbi:MAG: hypothetical protein K0U79_05795 [Gammaproteobacteria bacterium]|nr:hypothetical protein [Gammaproteobacteria bacterium]